MKLFYTFLLLLIITSKSFSQLTLYDWTNLNFPKFSQWFITSVYYDKVNDIFYAAGGGSIYKYTPTNKSWIQLDTDPDSSISDEAKINAMFIDSKGVFYAGTDDRTMSYISYDGGKKWKPIESVDFTLRYVNSFRQASDGTVYACTNTGLVKTENNGKSWRSVKNSPLSINDICFNDANGLVVATGSGIFYSTSGDTVWSNVSGLLYVTNRKLAKSNNGSIYSAANGYLAKSTNGGKNWIDIVKDNASIDSKYFYLIEFDKYGAIIVQNGLFGPQGMRKSTDDGKTWTSISKSSSVSSSSVDFFTIDNNAKIYAVGRYDGIFLITELNDDDIEIEILPNEFTLEQNYPNPFNPLTTITYKLPSQCHISLRIYDVLGNLVRLLDEGIKNAGTYKINLDASSLSSGTYFYQLNYGLKTTAKKMLFLK